MDPTANNLFSGLHKYAQQDENFTTEAFVFVLRHLASHNSTEFIPIFKRLTGGILALKLERPSDFRIETQTTFPEGTPDILITHPNYFILIEVKVEADLGKTQVDRYREIVARNQLPDTHKCLVLLTRYPPSESDALKVKACVLWRHVAEAMNSALKESTETITAFLMKQFVEFLRERRMWMEQVGWELKGGVESLQALIAMLEGAIQLSKTTGKAQAVRWDRIGYFFQVGTTRCWSGVYFSNPDILIFKAYDVPKGIEKVLGLGYGGERQIVKLGTQTDAGLGGNLLLFKNFGKSTCLYREVCDRFL